MEDRFYQQMKKGVLEMLVLKLICDGPTHGYGLLQQLKEKSESRFALKEGTLYPILYRLEDEGMIAARWSQGEGRTAPKKIYEATAVGREENQRRQILWEEFAKTVNSFISGGNNHG
jgi:PadR family transcriptional regulator PadR